MFYQDCLLADRGSAIYAAYDARSREEAMDYETEHSASGKHNEILALLTRPCLKVLLSSADNRGDSRSKEIHSRLGQVLLSTTSAINPSLFLNLFYRIDPIISIRVFFFIIDSSLFRRSGKFNVNKVTEPEVGDQS